MRFQISALVVVVALALTACGSDEDAGSSAVEAVPSTSAPGSSLPADDLTDIEPPESSTTTSTSLQANEDIDASAGCGSAVESGTTRATLTTADGREREYVVHVPASYVADTPVGVFVDLHPLDSEVDDDAAVRWSVEVAEDEGFLLVAPIALPIESGMQVWNLSPGPPGDPNPIDDVAYLAEVLDSVESQYCVDRARILLSGFSLGGVMASRAACGIPDRVSAVTTMSGIAAVADDCDAAASLPWMHMHGTADTYADYDASVADLETWVDQRDCEPAPDQAIISDGVERLDYVGCEADVVLVTLVEGGHRRAGEPDFPIRDENFGPSIGDTPAAAIAWEWFTEPPA